MAPHIAALAPPHVPPAVAPPRRAQYPSARVPGPNPSRRGGQTGGEYAIFLVSAVVLATHCAKLPRLPPSTPAGSSCAASTMLPILPLTLPSLHAFAILTPLCTPIAFPPPLPPFSSFPPPSSRSPLASPSALHALAAHLCVTGASNLSALMRHAGHVKELWQHMP
ncbi:hypothetical protein DFH09DRAFT_1363762 [Mycena vulgaris]|nr:hypothetical protein DFH09DRAFT_1363762 [Mycena vulgaris]